MKKLYRAVKYYIIRANEDYVTIHAAYSTFFIFIALFPFLMFLLNLLTNLNVSREYLIRQLCNLSPAYFHDLIGSIVNGIADNSTLVLMGVTVILAIWSSSSGIYGIMLGLNDVYRTYDTRNYFFKRTVAIIYTFLFAIALGLALFFLVLGNRFSELIIGKYPKMATPIGFVKQLRYPILFILFTLLFLIMYRVFPRLKTKFRDHILGAVLAAASWIIVSFLFSLYVDNFPASMMYGSLAMIVLFLMWMWLSVLIIFLGGELNAILYDKKHDIKDSEIRFRVLERIHRKEAKIAALRRLRLADRLNLRKATTRQVDLHEIQAEMKEEAKLKETKGEEITPEITTGQEPEKEEKAES